MNVLVGNSNIAAERRTPSLVRACSLSLALGVASLAWLTPQHAAANCVVTSGTGTAEAPDSGATITCSAGTPNPFPDGLDGNRQADDVTVILESGAGISTTSNDDEGIRLDNNAMIELQSGAFINTAGRHAEAIDIDNDGTVTLRSGASISTTGSESEGIHADDRTTILMEGGSSITTTGRNADGIDVDIDGTILMESGSSILTTGSRSEGIDADAGATITINAGASVTSQDHYGIRFETGTITIGGMVSSTDRSAIFQKETEEVLTVTGGESYLATIKILQGASVISTDSTAIQLDSPFGNNVIVAGTVTGLEEISGINMAEVPGTAIELGGGNDRLELQAGYNITGIVDAGRGENSLVFGGSQDATFDLSLIDVRRRLAPSSSMRGSMEPQYFGFGSFSKEGTSTWTFTGHTYEGIDTFSINGGTVLLDEVFLGSTFFKVATGTTLGGNGRFGHFVAYDGATISPGLAPGEIGTLYVEDAIFMTGSTYQVDIAGPDMSDRIVVSGGVDLRDERVSLNEEPSGGTVNVGGDLASAEAGQQYVILEYRNIQLENINGAGPFAGVNSTAFIDFSLEQDENEILLNVDARRGFTTAARTPNQEQVAMALDGLDGSAGAKEIENAILGLSLEEARAVFDAIGGEVHAEGAAGSMKSADDFIQFLLSFSGFSGGGFQTATLAPASDGYGADLLGGAAGYAPTFWLGGFGGHTDLDGDGNGGGYEASTFGIAGGAEMAVDAIDGVVGVSLGYSFSDLDVSGRQQNVDTTTFHSALYARTGAGRLEEGFSAKGALSYSHHWLDTSRTIVAAGTSRTAVSDYNGHTVSANAEVRYNMAVDMGVMDNTFVSPFARVNLSHTDLGSFAETGAGGLNLSGDSDAYNRGTATLGVALSGERSLGTAIWRPSVSVAYEYAAGDETEASVTLGGSPTTFVTKGADESRHRIRFGTLSEFVISDTASLTFATDSVWSQDRTEISAKAGAKFRF
jgi:hypothetical protein